VAEKQTRVAMRLPSELVKAVDGYAKSQTASTGVKYTRTDAMRALVTKGLEYLKRK
jgi:predicted DNA binding CopG/RHH family protein